MPNSVASQQVSWWDVHEFVDAWLEVVGCWPVLGTPSWCDLGSDHPAKMAAVFDSARDWALRISMIQETRCEASKSVAAALDWSAIGAERLQLDTFYAARPWLKRVGGGHV